MELRVLGSHNMESRDTRLESHLIDGVLALDAGSLTRSLGFDEQRGIRAVLLSHRHFDHVRDLLPLGLVMRVAGITVELYAIQDTADYLRETLLSGKLYPDFLNTPTPESPTYRLNVVAPYREYEVLDRYKVTTVPVPHSVPAAGFQVERGGVRLFYTGDATRGVGEAWKHVSPDVLLTEVTYGNEIGSRATQAGHLTPAYLAEALRQFKEVHGRFPRVIVSHMNPPWEMAVRREMKALAEEMGVEVVISHADMRLTL